MLTRSVYSAAMQMNAAPALPQRIGRLLRAKEFLVFYAIGLGTLDLGVALLTGWLYHHRPLHELLGLDNSALGDAIAGRTVALIVIAVLYLLLAAFLRAGYLRSLLGRLHLAPRDGTQFRRLLALMVLIALVGWGLAAALHAVAQRGGLVDLLLLVVVVATIPFLYADYAIIVSNVGAGRAIARSLKTCRLNLSISILMLVAPLAVNEIVVRLLPTGGTGSAGTLLPDLVIHLLVWGSVLFLADVVLICVYIDSIERGKIPPS
jgi:hypothetical protein